MMVTKEQIEEYQKAYAVGNSLIPDETYDLLLEEYVNDHGESSRPFTRNKQSAAVNDVVGTLSKTFGVLTPMREGQKTYKDWASHKFSELDDVMVVVQPKLDGCSVAYDCKAKRFFTRGDYDNGESVDVTELFVDQIPLIEELLKSNENENASAVKFEAILSKEVYEVYNDCFADKYKRPRDVVAASITSRNVSYSEMITLIPLRIYDNGSQYLSNAFVNDQCILRRMDSYDDIQTFIDRLLDNQACIEYDHCHFECDGVVVSMIGGMAGVLPADVADDTNVEVRDIIHLYKDIEKLVVDPEYEVAIKILNNVESTKLLNIEWQFGRSGRITPVAIVEPVKFGNVTVDHIGLSTFDRVSSMELRYGDTVRVMYNIVPYLLDSQHDGTLPIPLPNKCPMCGHPLDLHTLKQVQCTNPNCDGRKIGSIIRYCEKMKMFGVSEGIITKLWDNGFVKDIADLYTMDLMEASEVDGLGEKSMRNVINSIHSSSNGIPVHRWLGALPCNAVSDKTWRTILKSVYGDNMNACQYDIARMCYNDTPDEFLNKILWYTHGIGPATVASINEGIRNNWKTISTIIHYITFDKETGSNGVSKGVVCLSGTRDETLKTALKRRGYEVTDSFNKRCVAVVIPNPTFESSKVGKARDNGIPVYTMNQVINENVL